MQTGAHWTIPTPMIMDWSEASAYQDKNLYSGMHSNSGLVYGLKSDGF